MTRIILLGVPIDGLKIDEIIVCVDDFINSGTGHQLIAINASKIVLANQRNEINQIVHNSDINFVDGKSVIFAARILGLHIPELISGHLLMERLIEKAADKGYPVYFLGAKEEVVSKLANIFKTRFPELIIAGWRNGYWTQDKEEKVVDEVRNSKAKILFLALGSPRKEEWIYKYKTCLNIPVCMGVGGSFDVLAGEKKIEPLWIRNIGMAWFYRLIQEPKRLWKRYTITNSIFIYLLLKEISKKYLIG
jgi:N-acetylglucosaminyldiphosphoundecaprenol N-acetyl-beta-D-mannosaminyltransferase